MKRQAGHCPLTRVYIQHQQSNHFSAWGCTFLVSVFSTNADPWALLLLKVRDNQCACSFVCLARATREHSRHFLCSVIYLRCRYRIEFCLFSIESQIILLSRQKGLSLLFASIAREVGLAALSRPPLSAQPRRKILSVSSPCSKQHGLPVICFIAS